MGWLADHSGPFWMAPGSLEREGGLGMKAGGQESSAMRQQQPPQGRAEDCTPLEGDVRASGGRCAAERPQGVVSALVAPWGSAAPVWSRMCPREGQGLPASPRSFLLWLVAPPLRTSPSPYHSRPRGPLALWLLLVPAGALGAETSGWWEMELKLIWGHIESCGQQEIGRAHV